MDDSTLLRAYDEQLRTQAPSAISITRHGPLRLVTFGGGRGWVTYQNLGGADARKIRRLVPEVIAHYESDATITRIEWKTRGHDHAPGLHEALIANGFVAQEPESIMIGDAHGLDVAAKLPADVTLRRITRETDVRAMCEMVGRAFDDADSTGVADALIYRLTLSDGMELWVAEADGRMVSAGRLEPVRGTEFAGIWGGATLKEWRRQGIYRALTAERARSAIRMGKTLIHSDSTEDSRPILERAGLRKVSTTTPIISTADMSCLAEECSI